MKEEALKAVYIKRAIRDLGHDSYSDIRDYANRHYKAGLTGGDVKRFLKSLTTAEKAALILKCSIEEARRIHE